MKFSLLIFYVVMFKSFSKKREFYIIKIKTKMTNENFVLFPDTVLWADRKICVLNNIYHTYDILRHHLRCVICRW